VAGSSRPPESSPRRFRDLDGASGDKTTAETSMGLGPRGATTITGMATRYRPGFRRGSKTEGVSFIWRGD